MYVVTGEKSYLLTDYNPDRKYILAKFTDGNGKQWWQLAYRWGFWTYWLNRMGYFESGTKYIRGPMTFDSLEAAQCHLQREGEWLDRQAKSQEISVEFVGGWQ